MATATSVTGGGNMLGFVLAILASICWGVAPVAAKLALRDTSPIIGMAVRSLVAACLVTVWLTASGNSRFISHLDGRTTAWLIVEALLATVVGDAFYFYALKNGEAGQIGLIMASSPLITVLMASLLLGESLTTVKLFGAALVIGGLLLIGK